MRQMKSKTGAQINVVEHIILKNGWEYYVTDDVFEDSIVKCLVLGFEIELGDVDLKELKGSILSRSTDLNELLPCPGWAWV